MVLTWLLSSTRDLRVRMTARCFFLSPTTIAWLNNANDKLELLESLLKYGRSKNQK